MRLDTDQTQHPLTKAQITGLAEKSNLHAAWLLFCQFALTALIFVGMAVWPNPLTILLGTVLLGGRQLGFFILTHEAGHRSLFRSQQLNELSSAWLTAPMDFTNGRAYMREHLHHHRSVGTGEDPDLTNYADYPITRTRLQRKLKRDLTGRTGWRNLSLKLARFARFHELDQDGRSALVRGVIWHVLLLGALTYFTVPWLFLVWIAAQIFAYPAIVRVRQIAEHAAVTDLQSPDARRNTRTTIANPLVRLLLCPHGVNYHVEHHLLASVPIYHLARMHKMLSQTGYYTDVPVTRGYVKVLEEVLVPG